MKTRVFLKYFLSLAVVNCCRRDLHRTRLQVCWLRLWVAHVAITFHLKPSFSHCLLLGSIMANIAKLVNLTYSLSTSKDFST